MPAAWLGITDIKDCFHNMLIPEWLSDFFSPIPVRAKEVGMEGSTLLQNGCKVVLENETLVSLAWSVLPMGHSAQCVTETISSRAPALDGPAYETLRPGASTSRGFAELLKSPGTQTGPLLDGPERLEKPVVTLRLSYFLPFFQKATTDLMLPPIVTFQWRHSGPSIGIADGSRSLEGVKKTRTMASHEHFQRCERHSR